MPSPDPADEPAATVCRPNANGTDTGTAIAIDPAQITGVVLAGGRGSRMGGLDKGLQLYGGLRLAQHSLRRLQAQVDVVLVNANRHLEQYHGFGAPVVTDTITDFAGPLAGFIAAMESCQTPYLVTVPCDTPQFPSDLVARLAQALASASADIAMASAMEVGADGTPAWYRQPVFCLIKTSLLPGLRDFVAGGGRKIGAWTAQQHTVQALFDEPGAFANVNTLAQLQALQE